MKTRITALFMMLAITGTMLSGCGGSRFRTNNESTDSTYTTVEAEENSTEIFDSVDGMTDQEMKDHIAAQYYSAEENIDGISYSEDVLDESVINPDATGGEYKEKAGDLDTARKNYLTALYEDDSIVNEILASPEWTDEKTDERIKGILEKYSSRIMTSVAKFGITDYDFTKAYEVDDMDYYFDMYNSENHSMFILYIACDEDGTVTDILFEEQEG